MHFEALRLCSLFILGPLLPPLLMNETDHFPRSGDSPYTQVLVSTFFATTGFMQKA